MKFCSSCHAGCCRRYTVSLTGYDFLNIAKTMGFKISHFAEIVEVTDESEIENHFKHSALFKFTNNDCKYYYRFAVKMVESKLFTGTQKCMFLQEWANQNFNAETGEGVTARCGIYSCRPKVCAAYPSKFDKSGLFAVVCNSLNYDNKIPAYYLCPKQPDRTDFEMFSEGIISNLALQKFELDFFKNIAEIWNKKPSSYENFLGFIENIYVYRVSSENET